MKRKLSSSECDHHIVLYGLCTECGTSIDSHKEVVSQLNISGGHRIKMSSASLQKRSDTHIAMLIKSKKLVLILDLDHTLLHAVPYSPNITLSGLKTISLDGHTHYVKLRPNLEEFLTAMHEKFEMYIYTQGTREYALEIMKVIDSDNVYFKDRILTRSDFQHDVSRKSKQLDNLLSTKEVEKLALIVDDRSDVWEANLDNLISVRPFKYFTNEHFAQEVNNASGPSFSSATMKIPLPPSDGDRELDHVMSLLNWIHAKFYADVDVNVKDVKSVVKRLKKRILGNTKTKIAFHESFLAKDQISSLKMKAIEMGAMIVDLVDLPKHKKDKNSILVLSSRQLHPDVEIEIGSLQKEEGQLKIVDKNWLLASEHYWRKEKVEKYILFQTDSLSIFGDSHHQESEDQDLIDFLEN